MGAGARRPISGDQTFQVRLFLFDVFHLLGAGNFPLDGDGAGVFQLFEALKELWEIHLPLANGHFLAKLTRIGREEAVLGVQAVDVMLK